jgi:hypothetical protein
MREIKTPGANRQHTGVCKKQDLTPYDKKQDLTPYENSKQVFTMKQMFTIMGAWR